VADNKKKETDGKGEAAKKKGLPAIVLVVAGAVIGGAGVVFAVPPKEVVKEVAPKPVEIVDFEHPDVLKCTFNAKSKTNRVVLVEFRFVYTVAKDLEQKAFEQVKERWSTSKSEIYKLLKSRPLEEYESERGILCLEKDMIDDLDHNLFAGHKDGKIAEVTRILWTNILSH
jgi:flagellar basal body-associated protein FliL